MDYCPPSRGLICKRVFRGYSTLLLPPIAGIDSVVKKYFTVNRHYCPPSRGLILPRGQACKILALLPPHCGD